MRSANTLHRLLGKNGAAILTRIMGMLLAALAVEMFIRGAMLQIAGNTANNGQGP
jgi:small neutral amino acid transporter SnatA (MarC family)